MTVRLFSKSLMYLLPALVPALIYGGFFFHREAQREEQALTLSVSKTLTLAAVQIESTFDLSSNQFAKVATKYATCDQAREAATDSNRGGSRLFSQLAITDEEGQVLRSLLAGSTFAAGQPFISQSALTEIRERWMHWLDSNGKTTQGSTPSTPIFSLFMLAASQAETSQLLLATPITQCNHTLSGYVMGIVDLAPITNLLNASLMEQGRDGARYFLVDLSRARPTDLLSNQPSETSDVVNAVVKGRGRATDGNLVLHHWLRVAATGSVQDNLALAEDVPATLVVAGKIRSDFLVAQQHRLAAELLLLLAASAALLTLLIYLLLRSLSAPLVQVAKAMQSIAQGNLAARIPKGSSGELQSITNVFDAMASRLETKHHALEKNLALLHATLEANSDGILVTNADNKAEIANSRFFELWQIPPEGTSSLPSGATDNLPTPDLMEFPEQHLRLKRTLDGDPEATLHEQIRLRDGRVLDFHSYPFEIDGRTAGRVFNYRDVTDSVKLLDQLQFTHALVNASRDAVYCLDSKDAFKLVYVNDAACRHFQMSRERIIGMPLSHWDVEMNEERLAAMLQRIQHARLPLVFEASHHINPNVVVTVEMSANCIRHGNQDYIGGYIHDISNRKNAAAKQHKLQLELQQKHKMEALGQLTGGIAHDFNNLLGIILGYSGLAQETSLRIGQDKLNEYLEQITHAAERAKNLVAQMLAFTRRNPGKIEVVSIESQIRESIKLLSPTLPSTVEIRTHFSGDLPPVRMDTTQFQQILMNLAINARDAMQGQGCLEITTQLITERGNRYSIDHHAIFGEWVELIISDSGTGIAPDVLQHIFNPFFTTKEVGKGTGMGLPVVHGIMNNLGGHIIVESTLGKGTRFHLLFKPQTEGAHQTQALGSLPDQARSVQHERIMVVDDELVLANYLGELLSSAGYRPEVVTDSAKALSLLMQDSGQFDLLITDQTMPGVSGLEIIRKVREKDPGFPVLLCTGYSENVDEYSARKLGIGYLKKPVRAEVLLQTVADLLLAKSGIQADKPSPTGATSPLH